MTPPVVTAADVTVRYGHRGAVRAVDGVELTVTPGEIVGITGPSGCGKSTLLRVLAGIERPTDGTVSYEGRPAWNGRGRQAAYPRRGFAMAVFQDPFGSLDARWPVWRSVTEPVTARQRSVDPATLRGHARTLLDSAGLSNVTLETRPRQLSGGQRQRIAILRAIAARPALIVADEPTAQQDLITAAALTDLLQGAATAGTALVVVSHNRPWLASFADRVIHMRGGRLTDAIASPP
jgi:peptide/nickel transport system ATP-binding protein